MATSHEGFLKVSDGNIQILKENDCKYVVALGEIGCLERLWVFHPLEIFRT